MGYTELKNKLRQPAYHMDGAEKKDKELDLRSAVQRFIRESCEGLRLDETKANEKETENYTGKSVGLNQIPYNMEKDIDRLCMENAILRFLDSNRKEDAFDVYYCYLEMFVGDYDKTRRIIELLSEYEANGSGLLMKHRDHYSHSVYVFTLGLAIFEMNSKYKAAYKKYYDLKDEKEAAYHFLKYWGLSALFHDIGYPFELPFEQVASYFEVNGKARKAFPFVAYNEAAMDKFRQLGYDIQNDLKELYGQTFENTDEFFAYILADKLGKTYDFTAGSMSRVLHNKSSHPEEFTYFMDHAYFSATVLFKKLFCEMELSIDKSYVDALTAILMHNSLYKFSIANYKSAGNKPFDVELHPLAYLLMLCDELQCWDRTAYGRNSKKELHPIDCKFLFNEDTINATYIYDEVEQKKIEYFEKQYQEWVKKGKEIPTFDEGEYKKWIASEPKLKAYSSMYKPDGAKLSDFYKDIASIVDLDEIKLDDNTKLEKNEKTRQHLSNSNFINLYNFAVVLNARWETYNEEDTEKKWETEEFIQNADKEQEFVDHFANMSLEYKLSNINQAKGYAGYLEEIGCFYTDRPVDYEMVTELSLADLKVIGPMEHKRWLEEHIGMGWIKGEPEIAAFDVERNPDETDKEYDERVKKIKGKAKKIKRENERMHNLMIEIPEDGIITYDVAKAHYNDLPKDEKLKDTEPMKCIMQLLKMYDGIHVYRYKKM